MNWKRVLHHRYLGSIAAFCFLGFFTVQQARHESAIIPLVGAIVSLLWVLDDVLCEKKGWKTPGCIADKWLTKNIWFYSKVKEWIEEKAGS
jgi:hypothetical protein